MSGIGNYTTSENESRYFGEIHGEEASGWGQIIYPNGLVYDGECSNFGRHGEGQLSFSGEVSVAQIQPADLILPHDIVTFGDLLEMLRQCRGKARFVGLFESDLPHGPGTIFLEYNGSLVSLPHFSQ
jgi:hypothetical protein